MSGRLGNTVVSASWRLFLFIFRLTELQSVGRAGVLRLAGHAAVARVGEGVVVLVYHGETGAPVEVICCEAVLQHSQAGIELSEQF